VLKIVQNRNKLIEKLIGNLTNAIVHAILEKASGSEELAKGYHKESGESLNQAKQYRNKINPISNSLPERDIDYIKTKLINKIKAKLTTRINEGYKNIDLNLVDELVDKHLKQMNVV
jgi:hypothetical protein